MSRDSYQIKFGLEEYEIDGVGFKVNGFEFLDLFVYQHKGEHALGVPYPSSGIEYLPEEVNGKYLVSEQNTGFWLGDVYNDPEEAAYRVTVKLNELGADYVRERTEEILAHKE